MKNIFQYNVQHLVRLIYGREIFLFGIDEQLKQAILEYC